MWCGQHPAEGCRLQPARECEWFLQYQLKTGALPGSSEPCPGEGSRCRVSVQFSVPFPAHTHRHSHSPSRALSNLLEWFKEPFFFFFFFNPCMPVFPPDPVPGEQAGPCYQPQKWWLLSELPPSLPPPQSRSHKGALLKRSIPAPRVPGAAVPKGCRESLRGSKEKILTQGGSSSDIIKSHNKRENH